MKSRKRPTRARSTGARPARRPGPKRAAPRRADALMPVKLRGARIGPDQPEQGPLGWFLPRIESTYTRLEPRDAPARAARGPAAVPASGVVFASRLQPGAGEAALAEPARTVWLDRLAEYKRRKAAAARTRATAAVAPAAPAIPGGRNWLPLGPTVVLEGQTVGTSPSAGECAGWRSPRRGRSCTPPRPAGACSARTTAARRGAPSWTASTSTPPTSPARASRAGRSPSIPAIPTGSTSARAKATRTSSSSTGSSTPSPPTGASGRSGRTTAARPGRASRPPPAPRPWRARPSSPWPSIRATAPTSWPPPPPGSISASRAPTAPPSGSVAGPACIRASSSPRRAVCRGSSRPSGGAASWRRRTDRPGLPSAPASPRPTWGASRSPSSPPTRACCTRSSPGRQAAGSTASIASTRTTARGRASPTRPTSCRCSGSQPGRVRSGHRRRSEPDRSPLSRRQLCQSIALPGVDLAGGRAGERERLALHGPASIGTHAHADVHALVHTPGDPNELWCACDGGVFLNREPAAAPGSSPARTTASPASAATSSPSIRPTPASCSPGCRTTAPPGPSTGPMWSHVNDGDGGYCLVNWADPDRVLSFVQRQRLPFDDGRR